MKAKILENKDAKFLLSPEYNFTFDKNTGYFQRWGKTEQDDPDYSPYGPEIIDMELSTICHGVDGVPCKFCYKSNTGEGTSMSFDTFKQIFDKLPKTVTQIAFGIGDVSAVPDLWQICQYCRDHGVIPNITINGDGLTDEIVENLVKYMGAVAVSLYDYDLCYNTVDRLTKAGLKYVNIHCLLSKETYMKCLQVAKDKLSDSRLDKLTAIVYLFLKPKGRGVSLNKLANMEQYKSLVGYCLNHQVPFGFDSCGANNFLKAIKSSPNFDRLSQMTEPCESGCFSWYISVDGIGYPCSFSEGVEQGINLLKVQDFNKEVWNSDIMKTWREKLLKNKCEMGCRKCPVYDLTLGD